MTRDAIERPQQLVARLNELEARVAELSKKLADRESLLQSILLEKGRSQLQQLKRARELAAKTARIAKLDPATGLLRHGYFRKRLVFELRRAATTAEPLGLVLIDLDGFKRYNAQAGYDEGERSLGIVARSLPSPWFARTRPAAFGREGPDCFAIIAPQASVVELKQQIETTRNLVERLPLAPPRLTASVAAVLSSGVVEAEELIEEARRLLREVKARGGNGVELGSMG